MNMSKALATVVGVSAAFGAIGTGLGVLLGRVAPSFFRHVVRAEPGEAFDPVELGIGLGLVNGLSWGLVVGVLLVAILAWKETRRPRVEAPPATP